MYAIPNFQNPTGLTYSLESRQNLAEYLKRSGNVMVEDDPYGELRFIGEHLPNVYSFAPENVILSLIFMTRARVKPAHAIFLNKYPAYTVQLFSDDAWPLNFTQWHTVDWGAKHTADCRNKLIAEYRVKCFDAYAYL